MHGHKNIPSANPLFSSIIMSHPILHISTIRVKSRLQIRDALWGTLSKFRTEHPQISGVFIQNLVAGRLGSRDLCMPALKNWFL